MEQGRRDEARQQEQSRTPLRCPRCGSLETRFRYFNNRDLAQPRHSCYNCRRMWTEGGNLRNVPVGGRNRKNKKTKASSSTSGIARCQPPQSPLPLWEELQNSQYLRPMPAMVPQEFNSTMSQPVINQPAAGSHFSSYYFNDEISCLDAIQGLIQPQVINQHSNVGNQLSIGGANIAPPQAWNIQAMTPQPALPLQNPRHIEAMTPQAAWYSESYQSPNQANNTAPSHLCNTSLVQPTCPMNPLSQGIMTNVSFATSNPWLGNNSGGNKTDDETDASIDVDQWLDFSGCCSP